MRLSHDGGRNYPRRLERDLTVRAPSVPAAVYVYDTDGMGGLLVADFDVSLAARRGAADPHAQVDADAADFAALVIACGGRGFGDASPSGGRHGYVLWSASLPYAELRRVALALAARYPSLDPKPMLGRTDGLIRPPGSVHRRGGHQTLTTPIEHVHACLADRNGPDVWARLLDALTPELDALERADAEQTPAPAATWQVDTDHQAWLPRPGGPLPRLSPRLEDIAQTGTYDLARYASPSEARQAVLAGAAACGWRLADVTARLHAGDWPGMAGFYHRYRDDRTRAKSLQADWEKAIAWVAGKNSGRAGDTRGITHTGGNQVSLDGLVAIELANAYRPAAGQAGEYQQIRRWWSAMRAAEPVRWPGAHGITVRRVLRAVAAAAQMTGSTVVAFGCRSLALLAGLDESTVARVLVELREEADPFLDHVQQHHGVYADRYRLRIPASYAEAAAWRRWQPGRLGGIHPVFRALGGVAALLYEHLAGEPVRTTDLALLAVLSPTAVSTGLRALAEHGMAERRPGGWVRGPADPRTVAEHLGVPELVADTIARYRRERAEWRAWLELAEAARTALRDVPEYPIPLQAVADAGVPPWVPGDATGPPALTGG